MAWRFNRSDWVKEGFLDNLIPGKTFGEIEFAGIGKVNIDLLGNMTAALARKKITFYNPEYNPHSKLDGETAQENLTEYGREDAEGDLRMNLQRKIEGTVRDIYTSHSLGPNLFIEYFNTRNDTDLTNRSVIEDVPYTIVDSNPLWKSYYEYSVGDIDSVRKGILPRNIFIDKTNLDSLLALSNASTPSQVIGIYQHAEIINPTNEEKNLQERRDRCLWDVHYPMIKKLGLTDENDENLIHVIYDPSVCSKDYLKKTVSDSLGRITLATFDEVPNFSEKNVEEWKLDFLSEFKQDETMLMERKGLDSIYRILKREYFEMISTKSKQKKYGMTRTEWMDLVTNLCNLKKKGRL